MLISTRGRYALRVMIDLAEHSNGEYIAMKEVAARQEISLKYLERILPILVKEKMIEGVHGKGGGYRLTRKPSEYKVGEILRLTEGNLAPVTCVECEDEEREQKGETRTIGMWEEIDKIVNDYFDSKTIEDLMYKDVAAYI
ncbi:MAG: Rrf2 family transcriptional regulator [Lachnospiraceae bacterium]|jgi:Rrf2 family protein|nr:Rrf2 family transcriptional regulator [Lachnospiraceae bacterium]MBP5276236.1 Rrf2 family transcriptional regulator [Lachnospiraceae bacterium]